MPEGPAKPSLELLATSRVYDLAYPLGVTTPMAPTNTPFRLALTIRHGDIVRAGGVTVASDLMSIGGHTGTHVDALAHIGRDGRLHEGLDASEASRGGRFQSHGVSEMPPIVCRGVLLDMTQLNDGAALSPGQRITGRDFEAVAKAEGVAVRQGDAVLVHTGWAGAHYGNARAYVGWETGVPGPDEDGARWLAGRGIGVTGADTIAYEWIEAGAGHSRIPVHALLLVDHGIYIVEVMKLDELARDSVFEFLFILAPPKLEGATSAPVRPLAIALAG